MMTDGTFLGLLVELDNSQRNMFRGRSDSASAPHAVNGELHVLRLSDFGRSVETSRIADAYYDWRTPQLSMSSLAVDRTKGPYRNRAYVVWPDELMPMVAVNRDGVVAVSWYDRRDNLDNLSYWPRLRASLDGGTTWLESVRESSEPNRLTAKDVHLNGGDTAGLAADADGRFHVVWIDNRTGVAQAWASAVEVKGSVRAR